MATKKTTPDTGTSAAAADATKAPAASVPGDKPVDDAAALQPGQEAPPPAGAGTAPDAAQAQPVGDKPTDDAAVPQPGQEAPPQADAGTAPDVAQAQPASDKPVDEPAPQPEPDAKRWYMVTALTVRHDGRVYGVGKDIELTEKQAKRLAGLVAPAPVTSKE